MLDVVNEQEVQSILNRKQVDRGIVQNEVTEKIPLVKVMELPSGFKGYPEGTVISYEPITLGELEALNNSDNVNIERNIAMLLNSIHCNTMRSWDLYYWDVMYIGIQRKLLAFGDTIGVVYGQCPECGNIVKKEFSYTEIEFKEIEAPALPLFTKLNDVDVEINLITIKDFLELDLEKGELDVYARMIKNLPYEKAYELISNCTGKDSKKIRFIDKQLNYGMKPFFVNCDKEIEKENPKYNPEKKNSKKTILELCNQKVRLEVRSPFEVVFPEGTDSGSDDFEIQYGRE